MNNMPEKVSMLFPGAFAGTAALILLFCSAMIFLSGCSAPLRASAVSAGENHQAAAEPEVPAHTTKASNLGVVAVAEIVIEHPAANRVFSEQVVRDAIAREIHQTGRVKVLDWSRLKAVLFRRNLEWSDLVANPEERKQVKEVLLNDYFLAGSIYSYGERMDYSSSALSKSRTQVAEVVMDLFLKDALSNEIIASSRGTGVQERTITQSLGFGAAGGSDPSLAKSALHVAVRNGVQDLLLSLETHIANTQQKERSK